MNDIAFYNRKHTEYQVILFILLLCSSTSIMGDLQATVEFLVELYKFYNVDLFIRG